MTGWSSEVGSPPRVWGPRTHRRAPLHQPRFTPTRVGTTLPGVDLTLGEEVHPHACGDHADDNDYRCLASGSPPRVWGPPLLAGAEDRVRRFTPTRVGTTDPRLRLGARRLVHPHACGDHDRSQAGSGPVCGSPPRVWGPRGSARGAVGGHRFTPTRVGTTFLSGLRPSDRAVHPHACGDHRLRRFRPRRVRGSPPRVWGPRERLRLESLEHRFTPTRVGTTPAIAATAAAPTVHPHACGDHGLTFTRSDSTSGSPPRVWGPLRARIGRRRPTRFTPTRVGTTRRGRPRGRPPAVHPHACGDHV